jgi:hypothetical protein
VRCLGGLGSDARVTDGATEMDVPESVYRARGYLSLLKKVVGVGIGLQLIAPEFMGRSEYIADVHDWRDINGIFRHGQRA